MPKERTEKKLVKQKSFELFNCFILSFVSLK